MSVVAEVVGVEAEAIGIVAGAGIHGGNAVGAVASTVDGGDAVATGGAARGGRDAGSGDSDVAVAIDEVDLVVGEEVARGAGGEGLSHYRGIATVDIDFGSRGEGGRGVVAHAPSTVGQGQGSTRI